MLTVPSEEMNLGVVKRMATSFATVSANCVAVFSSNPENMPTSRPTGLGQIGVEGKIYSCYPKVSGTKSLSDFYCWTTGEVLHHAVA